MSPAAKKKSAAPLRLVKARKEKSKDEVKRISQMERLYFKTLHHCIDEIYQHAKDVLDWSWSNLAVQANLSYGTIENLGNRYTKWPRFYTIFKLARAVGFKLSMQGSGNRKKVVLRKAG